jgi:alpha-L-fucosidase
LLLNFPIDKRGLVHENDARQLKKMVEKIRDDFSQDLADQANIDATIFRSQEFGPQNIIDHDPVTYWAAPDGVLQAAITLQWDSVVHLNRLLLQEFIPLGQRIKSFTVEYLSSNNQWINIATETTIGYKRILRFDAVPTQRLKMTILDARACPTISNLEVYYADPLLYPPKISRSKAGQVTLEVPEAGVDIFYTTNGRDPTIADQKYTTPFHVLSPGIVNAVAIDFEG